MRLGLILSYESICAGRKGRRKKDELRNGIRERQCPSLEASIGVSVSSFFILNSSFTSFPSRVRLRPVDDCDEDGREFVAFLAQSRQFSGRRNLGVHKEFEPVGAFLGFLYGGLLGIGLVLFKVGGRKTKIPFGPVELLENHE